jgi:hypothetical protein
VTVYGVDEAAGTASVADLTDEPLDMPLDALMAARGRIKKDRHRLLGIEEPVVTPDLAMLVRGGLEACHHELLAPSLAGAPGNARLEALRTWADRLEGSRAKERWEVVYRPGANMWRALCSLYDFVEHYGTGGGLCRPLFADFLAEAGTALGHPPLAALAERYARLGAAWSALAEAALPDEVPMLREARELYARKAELLHVGAPAEEVRAVWSRLAELEQQAREEFPLSEAACAELRTGLQARVRAMYADEVGAHAALLDARP